jgi:hypothetical protein
VGKGPSAQPWVAGAGEVERGLLAFVRRAELLKVLVFCPHYQRPVSAARNLTIDRLVSCDEAASCRDPAPPHAEGSDHARPFPCGCPVYPSLAK